MAWLPEEYIALMFLLLFCIIRGRNGGGILKEVAYRNKASMASRFRWGNPDKSQVISRAQIVDEGCILDDRSLVSYIASATRLAAP